MTRTRANIQFAAISPYIDTAQISSRETPSRNGDYILWGEGNAFPDYLLDLYGRVATLRSIINGCVDFVGGNGAELSAGRLPYTDNIVNRAGQTAADLVNLCGFDYFLTGGFAIQVIRDRVGVPTELYHIDVAYLRTNAEVDTFYYCEDWRKRRKILRYPAYMPSADHPASIVYFRNTHAQVYPAPLYGASLKACETEAAIDTFHLANIRNNFVSSLFVNFNNGVPTDEVKDEVERAFCEKFAGAENGGRVGFSWNDNKESATTFTTFDVRDFGARYDALAKHCRQQIFTSFRAVPSLFGVPTASGFSMEEYEQAFKLFNRTQIRPVQGRIIAAVDAILGPGALTIIPFTLD